MVSQDIYEALVASAASYMVMKVLGGTITVIPRSRKELHELAELCDLRADKLEGQLPGRADCLRMYADIVRNVLG